MNFVTSEYRESLQYDQEVFRILLNFLPKKDRAAFTQGVSVDTLAEIVTAYARNTRAANENGYDLEDGVEVKYAKYQAYKSGNYMGWSADIANLNSKRGKKADLCVIISQMTGLFGIELKFLVIPWKVWEKNIKGNKFSFCFQTAKWKWYTDYLVTKKEYGL